MNLSPWLEVLCQLDESGSQHREAQHFLADSEVSPERQAHLARAVDLANSVSIETSQDSCTAELLHLATGLKGSSILPLLSTEDTSVNSEHADKQVILQGAISALKISGSFKVFKDACFIFLRDSSLLQFLDILEAVQIGPCALLDNSVQDKGRFTLDQFALSLAPLNDKLESEAVLELAWAATQILLKQQSSSFYQSLLLVRLLNFSIPSGLSILVPAFRALECLVRHSSKLKFKSLELWLDGPYMTSIGSVVDQTKKEILDCFCANLSWDASYEWATLTNLELQHVQHEEALSIWSDWQGSGISEKDPARATNEVISFLTSHDWPPSKIVEFLLVLPNSTANRNEEVGALQNQILKKCWELSDSLEVCSEEFLEQLRKTIALFGLTLPETSSGFGWTPFILTQAHQDGMRTTSQTLQFLERAGSTQDKGNPGTAPLTPLLASKPMRSRQRVDNKEVHREWASCVRLLKAWSTDLDTVKTQLAVRKLLDEGDTVAARSLSKQLTSPPIELALVESALRVLPLGPSAPSSPSPSNFVGVVPVAVLSLLRKRGHTLLTTEDLLESLCKSCKPGSGGTVCRWVKAIRQAAQILGTTSIEVMDLGPEAVCEALLLKAAPIEILHEYVSVTRLSHETVAYLLASIFFKGLLLEHTWKDGSTGKIWGTEAFVKLVDDLSDPVDIANALLRLLLDRHPAITAQVEVDFILAAHRFYSKKLCFEGIDSLLDFTTLSIGRWIQQKEYRALAMLASGMGRYKPIRQALDSLITNEALETILQKTPATTMDSQGKAGTAVNRLAILASIEEHGDHDHLSMAYMHFNLQRQYAKQLCIAAEEKEREPKAKDRLQASIDDIQIQKLWLQAAQIYARAECPEQAKQCADRIADRKQ